VSQKAARFYVKPDIEIPKREQAREEYADEKQGFDDCITVPFYH
jgi:hypothetical protein